MYNTNIKNINDYNKNLYKNKNENRINKKIILIVLIQVI